MVFLIQKFPSWTGGVPRQMNEVNLTRRGGGINRINSENIDDFHMSELVGCPYLHVCKRITIEGDCCYFEKN